MTGRRLRSRIPAGLVDSGGASLASFLAGLLAIWVLDTSELGVYAVFFSAFLAGSYVPRHLVLMPLEMAAIAHPRHHRGALVANGLRTGAGAALAGAMVIVLATGATWSLAATDVVVPLTVTAALATFLSPLQDHVRRMLHLADESWRAATTSLVQLGLVAALVALVMLPSTDLPLGHGWLPFGVLVVANAGSLGMGLVLALGGSRPTSPTGLTFGELSKPGRWLMVSAVSTKGTALLAASLIGHIAGAEVLGYAEAARVAAQPLMVLGIGLSDVMSPRLMESARDGDYHTARRAERVYLGLFWFLGAAFLAVASFDWAVNPMAHLVPNAYVIPGLTAASIAANLAVSAVYAHRLELLGGRRERSLARIDAASAVLPVVGAATAAVTLSFARPLGLAAQGAFQFLGYRHASRRMFGQAHDEDDTSGGGVAPGHSLITDAAAVVERRGVSPAGSHEKRE